MTTRERAPRPFILVSAIVAVLGSAALFASWRQYPPIPSLGLALLLIAAVMSENYAVELKGFTVSLAFPLVIAAAQLYGPGAAGLVAALTFTNVAELRRRRPISIHCFNLGQVLLWSSAGAWIYLASGAQLLGIEEGGLALLKDSFPVTITGILAAGVAATFANLVLAALGFSVLRQVAYGKVLLGILEYIPSHLALAFVGFLIALVLVIEPLAFPLFLFPLFLARQVFHSYSSLKETYLDTVRSLVGALEAKDPYTRGHSERVAIYAQQIATNMGIDEASNDRLTQAALLHDIGKLALASAILTKPGRLSDGEFGLVRNHPSIGADMVLKIPALRGLSEPVRCHHERVDGEGYPLGLTGEEIPLLGRILAVADAYDAMTTQRSYRSAMSHEEAVAELLSGIGGQFDGKVVECFLRACSEGKRAEGVDADVEAVPQLASGGAR